MPFNKIILIFCFLFSKCFCMWQTIDDFDFLDFEEEAFHPSTVKPPNDIIQGEYPLIEKLSDCGFNDSDDLISYLDEKVYEFTNRRSEFKDFLKKILNNIINKFKSTLMNRHEWAELGEEDFLDEKLSEGNFAQKEEIDEKTNILVVGDLHGNYDQFKDILKDWIKKEYVSKDLKIASGIKLVCLGDFVDRGPGSLEICIILFLLKILNFEDFILLKGNHEDESISRGYGFYDELIEKLGGESEKFFESFIFTFRFLPEALYLNFFGKRALFSHGGWNQVFDENRAESFLESDKKYQFTFMVDKQNLYNTSPFIWHDISPYISEPEYTPGRGYRLPVDFVLNQMIERRLLFYIKAHDHFMPKKRAFQFFDSEGKEIERDLSSYDLEDMSSGFCCLGSGNKEAVVFCLISASILYEQLSIAYYPTYMLLDIGSDDWDYEEVIVTQESNESIIFSDSNISSWEEDSRVSEVDADLLDFGFIRPGLI